LSAAKAPPWQLSKIHEHADSRQFRNSEPELPSHANQVFTENEPQPDFTRVETNHPLTAGVDLTYRF
jgi:hypothetical protein